MVEYPRNKNIEWRYSVRTEMDAFRTYHLIPGRKEVDDMRILLAEDDRQLNQTLTISLELEGFTVDPCYDGEEALYYGEQNIHDIILLDRRIRAMNSGRKSTI